MEGLNKRVHTEMHVTPINTKTEQLLITYKLIRKELKTFYNCSYNTATGASLQGKFLDTRLVTL